MKTALGLALFFSLGAPAAFAERAPDATTPVTVHPMVEIGIGSTFVARGVPQYSDRTALATLNRAVITLDGLGPGSLTIGCSHQAALTHTAMQSGTGGKSPQFDPMVSYGMRLGRVEASAGYVVHVWPAWADHPDGMHEIQLKAAVEGLVVRPAIEVDAEFVRMHGVYANASVTKTFTSGAVAVTPGLVVGVHGYDKPFGGTFDVPFALREVTANVHAKWKISPPFYLAVRAGYSYTGIQNWWMEPSVIGRSTPSLTLAFGAAD